MISVVMISMNEEKAVGEVIPRIREAVPSAEIILVDSSHDRTHEIAASLGARVIRQYPPCGYGRAMDLALRAASGEVVVTLDCDGSYPAERIPEMVQWITEKGADVVDGSRLRSKPGAMPWPNYLANVFFALAASVLFCRKFSDLHSGMRAYRRSVLEKLDYDPSGPALPVDLLLKPVRLGYRVKSLFIDYHERIGQTTLKPWPTVRWTFLRILRCRFGRTKAKEING